MSQIKRLLNILPICIVLGVVAILPPALALSQSSPEEGLPVVVISAPWTGAEGLAIEAGGQLIAPGRLGAIGLVWSPNPKFIDALYEAGAWVVLDGDLSGVLCVT